MSNSFTAGNILQMVYAKNFNRWPTANESEDAREFPSDDKDQVEIPKMEIKPLPVARTTGPRLPEKKLGKIPTVVNPAERYRSVPFYNNKNL